MKSKQILFIALLIIAFTSCGNDKDEPNYEQPTGAELSIEPYFKYVGLSLEEIQSNFSTPLENNVMNYYLRNQWIYNNKFNVIFWVTPETNCTSVRLRKEDETTNFDLFKLYTKEAYSSLGEPKYAVMYNQNELDGSDREILYELSTPYKKGGYNEANEFAEKNNVSKIGHIFQMTWLKNGFTFTYTFNTTKSEIRSIFQIDIRK